MLATTLINPYQLIQSASLSKIDVDTWFKDFDTHEQQFYPEKDCHIEYLFNRKFGISCCMKDGILSSIHLYIQGDKVFQKYTGMVPYNIGLNFTNQSIVSYLGEPDEKLGGSLTNISIVYNRLGLEIYFLAKVWDLDKAGIDQIVMFPIKKVDKICAVCRQSSESRCSKCKLVYYCKAECQNTHWKVHKQFCKPQ